LRIGLLGGSFNPAHDGHRHVALLAKRRLRLDQVWLLVSPGNPLKASSGMAALPQRLASAARIADGRRIVATGIEAALGTRYTVATLAALRRHFPRARFVWLMGADNLEQLPAWNRWTEIARSCVFAVLPRPSYNHRALAGQAARRLRGARRAAHIGPALAGVAAPGWVFLPAPQHAASATAIRAAAAAMPRPQRKSRADASLPIPGVLDHRPEAAHTAATA
jgi:nicotinate-nucleotide adenylyltransferase